VASKKVEDDLDFEWEIREDSTPYLKHMAGILIIILRFSIPNQELHKSMDYLVNVPIRI